jgi:hypothetical protein
MYGCGGVAAGATGSISVTRRTPFFGSPGHGLLGVVVRIIPAKPYFTATAYTFMRPAASLLQRRGHPKARSRTSSSASCRNRMCATASAPSRKASKPATSEPRRILPATQPSRRTAGFRSRIVPGIGLGQRFTQATASSMPFSLSSVAFTITITRIVCLLVAAGPIVLTSERRTGVSEADSHCSAQSRRHRRWWGWASGCSKGWRRGFTSARTRGASAGARLGTQGLGPPRSDS